MIYTLQDVPKSGTWHVPAGSRFTDSARDAIRDRGIVLSEVPEKDFAPAAPPAETIALGADHGGFRMKEALKPIFAELGLSVRDVGVHDETPADYPDIALAVAELVAGGQASRGVIVDGAGIGSAMAANKVPGIRAALCYDRASARNSREHNDSNVLTLGGRLLTLSQAEEVLRTWLAAPFAGGRHAARIRKISEIEKRFATWTPPNSSSS